MIEFFTLVSATITCINIPAILVSAIFLRINNQGGVSTFQLWQLIPVQEGIQRRHYVSISDTSPGRISEAHYN